MSKIKLTVIFGKVASDYALEHGTKAAVKAFRSGKLKSGVDGTWKTYEMDTVEDVEMLTKAIGDAWGWDASYFDSVQGPDGKWVPKCD